MSIINSTSSFVSKAADDINNYTKQAQDATEGSGGGLESVNQAANWIKEAADSAMGLIDKARLPLQQLPPILQLCRFKYLAGLSETVLTAQIVQALADKGFITEINYDGTPNRIIEFVQCIVGPLVQHIKDNAAVQGIMETPTGIPMQVIGGVQ